MEDHPSGNAAVVERHPVTGQHPEEPEGGRADRVVRRHAGPARLRRRLLSVLAVAGGVVAAGLALRGVLQRPADVVGALRIATGGWLALAAVAEALSMSMFARRERRLLGAFGLSISVPRAEALAYAGSALSISMPAGAVVSAGVAYRQYRSRGASHRVAASVIVLSGVLSAAGLAIVYGVDRRAHRCRTCTGLSGRRDLGDRRDSRRRLGVDARLVPPPAADAGDGETRRVSPGAEVAGGTLAVGGAGG
jgi:hypothetical protein